MREIGNQHIRNLSYLKIESKKINRRKSLYNFTNLAAVVDELCPVVVTCNAASYARCGNVDNLPAWQCCRGLVEAGSGNPCRHSCCCCSRTTAQPLLLLVVVVVVVVAVVVQSLVLLLLRKESKLCASHPDEEILASSRNNRTVLLNQ